MTQAQSDLQQSQINDWINSATPDQLVQLGTSVVTKINSLDSSYKRRFMSDPHVTQLFNKQPV